MTNTESLPQILLVAGQDYTSNKLDNPSFITCSTVFLAVKNLPKEEDTETATALANVASGTAWNFCSIPNLEYLVTTSCRYMAHCHGTWARSIIACWPSKPVCFYRSTHTLLVQAFRQLSVNCCCGWGRVAFASIVYTSYGWHTFSTISHRQN